MEGTAGNTGIGLALAAASFGYNSIICMTEVHFFLHLQSCWLSPFNRELTKIERSRNPKKRNRLFDWQALTWVRARSPLYILNLNELTAAWKIAVLVPAVPYMERNNYVHVAERVANNLKRNGVRTLCVCSFFFRSSWLL